MRAAVSVAAVHEIGHVLGLTHSDDPADVMSPYYIATRVALSDNCLLYTSPSPRDS